MQIPCDLLSASVVVLMAIGELNTLSGMSWLAGTVGVASVKKSCHSEFLEEIQVPVPWPGLTAPWVCRVNVSSSCYNSFIAHLLGHLSFMLLQNEHLAKQPPRPELYNGKALHLLRISKVSHQLRRLIPRLHQAPFLHSYQSLILHQHLAFHCN